MIIDDVPSSPTHTNVELGAKVDCKIEQQEVSILSDATALHASLPINLPSWDNPRKTADDILSTIMMYKGWEHRQ